MKNRIRLPLYVKHAQYPTEASRFRLANGETKTLSVTIRKVYDLETDYLTERMHERLVVALNHDEVTIEGDRYVGNVAVDGDYQIDYPDFLDYPLGKAGVRLQVTPFDVTNDNCQTCEEASQLSLEDDTFPDPLAEGSEDNEINVFENDSICCSPVTAGITSFNTAFVDSAVIDADTGIVSISIKDPSPSGANVLLATYRVTCPDGVYDEANIYATVTGSIETCEPPSEMVVDSTGIDTAEISWDASPSAPDEYGYQLFECDNPGVIVQQGIVITNSVSLSGLTPGTCYDLVIWAICDEGNISDTVSLEFTTDSDLPGCGRFLLTNDLYPDNPTGIASYMDCGGTIRQTVVKTTRLLCMMMDSAQIPTYFVVEDGSVIYEYQSPCADSGTLVIEVADEISLDTLTGITNDVALPISGATDAGTWISFTSGVMGFVITAAGSGSIRVYYNGVLQDTEPHTGSGSYGITGLSVPVDGVTIRIEID